MCVKSIFCYMENINVLSSQFAYVICYDCSVLSGTCKMVSLCSDTGEPLSGTCKRVSLYFGTRKRVSLYYVNCLTDSVV